MDFFREYGITQEEIINTMSDAINLLDTLEDTDGTADRLTEAIAVLKQHWNMED